MTSPSDRPGVYRPTFLPENSKFSETVLPILSSILSDLCKTNDRCQPADKSQMKITKFHAAQVPPISIEAYLKRIAQYSEASDTCYILALVYLDRIQARPEFLVTSLNIHRLLITSVMVAAKFFDDHYYNNAFYARIGGISKEEMNSLELEFLFMIGFSLSVSNPEFVQYDSELRAHFARREAAAAAAASSSSQQFQQPLHTAAHPSISFHPVPVSAPAYSAPASSCAQPQRRGASSNTRGAPSNGSAPFSFPAHAHASYFDSKESFGAFHPTASSMQVEDSPKFRGHAHSQSAGSISAHPGHSHSHGIAIRAPSKSRSNATGAPNCSPPVSDFSAEYPSNQWVMIK